MKYFRNKNITTKVINIIINEIIIKQKEMKLLQNKKKLKINIILNIINLHSL